MIPRKQGEHMRQRIIDAIGRFIDQEERPPTVRDICQLMGVGSTGHISYHLKQLIDDGKIEHEPGSSRSLRLVNRSRGAALALADGPTAMNSRPRIPLMGTIAAGQPLLASVETDEYVDLLPARENVFALRVSGNSMIGDHIRDGDVVLIERRDSVRDGEMAVALIREAADDPGAATLKRIYLEPAGMLRLQPSNPDMPPMYYPAHQVLVQGRVIAVLRTC